MLIMQDLPRCLKKEMLILLYRTRGCLYCILESSFRSSSALIGSYWRITFGDETFYSNFTCNSSSFISDLGDSVFDREMPPSSSGIDVNARLAAPLKCGRRSAKSSSPSGPSIVTRVNLFVL